MHGFGQRMDDFEQRLDRFETGWRASIVASTSSTNASIGSS
jgi:hypothetical protein